MRQETQRWDGVRVTVEIVTAGVGQTGLSPTVSLRDIDTGNWVQVGGASLGVGYATNPMVEVDAVNLPGLYEYAISSAIADNFRAGNGGNYGWYARVTEATTSLVEHIKIDVLATPNAPEGTGGRPLVGIFDAMFRLLVATEDGAASRYTATVGTVGSKFYTSIPAVPASSYVDRKAVLYSSTYAGGETTAPIRIGGVFTDGGGTYFLLQNLDGSSYTGALPASVGSSLYVSMENVVSRVGVVETDAISAASISAAATAEIAGGVWDEASAGHVVAGTFGKSLGDLTGLSALSISDTVWTEPIGDHSGVVGSTAEALAAVSPAAISNAVWDELLAGHIGAGSSGAALASAGAGTSPADISNAVWNDATASHVAAGTMGRALSVIHGMVQANHRMKSPTYDPNGRLLTAQLVVYPTGPDAVADTNAIATFNYSVSYDIGGNTSTILSSE